MYDDLRKALVEAYSLVNWYALGEAKRLAITIAQVVKYHRENPDEEKAQRVLKLTAQKTADFLGRMGNGSKPEAQELQKILTNIEMEI